MKIYFSSQIMITNINTIKKLQTIKT